MAAKIPLEITANTTDAQRDIDKVDKSLDKLGDTSKKASGGLSDAAEQLTGVSLSSAGAVGGIVALIGGLQQSVAAAMEAESIQADLNATLLSTKGAAGLTADEINNMAAEMSNLTGIEDDSIVSAQSMLLTFTNIGKDVFPMATEAMLNMSVKFGGLEAASMQLGKALNDPIAGVGALRRVGVQLTDQQEEQINKFMAVNDIASAQKIILGELAVEFGGLAEAAGNTTAGKMAKLQNAIGNLSEEIGAKLLPVLADAAEGLVTMITWSDKLTSILNKHSAEVAKTSTSYEDYTREMVRSQYVSQGTIATTQSIDNAMVRYGEDIEQVVTGWGFLSRAEFEGGQKTNELTGRLGELRVALMNEQGAFTDTGSAAINYGTALDSTGKNIAAAKLAADNLNLAMQTLTPTMLLNMAAANLNGEQQLTLAGKMGLIDAAAVAGRGAMERLTQSFKDGEIGPTEYMNRVAELNETIAKLQGKTIIVKTIFTEEGRPPEGYGGKGYYGPPETGGGGGGATTPTYNGPQAPSTAPPGYVPQGMTASGGNTFNVYASNPMGIAQEIARIQELERLKQ
jgi:hypothetical protein